MSGSEPVEARARYEDRIRERYGHEQSEHIFYNARLLSEGDPALYFEMLGDVLKLGTPRAPRL